MKHRYECIKEALLCAIESQLCDLDEVDAKELGEVVDMVKDLEEAAYYYTITEAMEESEEEGSMYYTTSGRIKKTPMKVNGDWDKKSLEMREMSWEHNNDMSHSQEHGMEWHDKKMGRSPMARKTYLEKREMDDDKTAHMHDLEKYMQELAQDIVEMVEGATPEERQYLSKKISTLSTKLASTNG